MKVGIKIYYPQEDYMKKILEHVDFFEVMAIEAENYEFLKQFDIPFIIHTEHGKFGVNIADPELKERSSKALEFAIKLADMTDARTIIIHPGFVKNGGESEKTSLEFLKNYTDSRIVIENMPIKNDRMRFLGNTAEDMARIMRATGFRMNLDVGHSSATASLLGKDHVEFTKSFMGLKPGHYHFSDSKVESGVDMHLHLGEGNLNLKAFRQMLPKNAWVTIETYTDDFQKQLNDIAFMRD
jgi:endonuclease IV